MGWTLALVLFLGVTDYGASGYSFITPLANYVKSLSDPDVPPQKNVNAPVEVTFQHGLLNIADVDQTHNTYLLETYAMAEWDTGISWDPAEYGGIDTITLPTKYFWTPQLQPINTAVEVTSVGVKTLMLYCNGVAYYERFLRLQNLCDVSSIRTGVACNYRNALWGHSRDQVTIVDVKPEESGYLTYFEGSKFQILAYNHSLVDVSFDGKTYQILDSWMTIQEKPREHHSGPLRMSFEWH